MPWSGNNLINRSVPPSFCHISYKCLNDKTVKHLNVTIAILTHFSLFVHDIRNYALHRSIPITNATLTVAPTRDRLISTVCLSTDSLRQWDGWSQHGVLYLQHLADKLPLLDVVMPYKKLVSEFNSWMVERVKETHAEAFRELEKYRAELKDMLFCLHVNIGAENMHR